MMTDDLRAGFGESRSGVREQHRMDVTDRRSDGHAGRAGEPRPGVEGQVPQALRASLSLRNKRFWNHD